MGNSKKLKELEEENERLRKAFEESSNENRRLSIILFTLKNKLNSALEFMNKNKAIEL